MNPNENNTNTDNTHYFRRIKEWLEGTAEFLIYIVSVISRFSFFFNLAI